MRIMIKYVVAAALCIGTGGAYAQSDGAYAPSPEPRLAMMTPSAPSSPSSHVQKVGGCNGVSCEHGSNGGQTCRTMKPAPAFARKAILCVVRANSRCARRNGERASQGPARPRGIGRPAKRGA